MASISLDSHVGSWRIIDKRSVPNSVSPISATLYAACRDVATTDAALVTLNAAYWTQARLDATMLSDKFHALRVAYDAAGIS